VTSVRGDASESIDVSRVERESLQLAALADIARLLDHDGIEYWLFGGWAVDFHRGQVTREHDDVDFAVWLDDVARIGGLLAGDGWTHVPSPDDNGGTGYARGGVRFELTFLVRDDDGAVVIPLRNGSGAWLDDARDADVRELHGVRARVVTLDALTRSKSRIRNAGEDAAKDEADTAVLRGISR
jgi:hypothetical protein